MKNFACINGKGKGKKEMIKKMLEDASFDKDFN